MTVDRRRIAKTAAAMVKRAAGLAAGNHDELEQPLEVVDYTGRKPDGVLLFGDAFARPEPWDRTLLQDLKNDGLVPLDYSGNGWDAYQDLRDDMLNNGDVDWRYGFPTLSRRNVRNSSMASPLFWYRSPEATDSLQKVYDRLADRSILDRGSWEDEWVAANDKYGHIDVDAPDYAEHRAQQLDEYDSHDRNAWRDPMWTYFANFPEHSSIYERIPDDEWWAEKRPEGLMSYRAFGRNLFDNPETGELHYDSPDGPVFIDWEGGYYNPNGEQIMRPLPRSDFWNPTGYRLAINQYIADHPDTYGDDMFGQGWQEMMGAQRPLLPSVTAVPPSRPMDWTKQVNLSRPKLSPQQNAFYLARTAHRKQPTVKTYDDMQRTADALDDKSMGQVGMRYYQDTLDQKYPNWQTDQGQARAWMDDWSSERSRRRFNAKNWKKQTGESAGNEWNIRPTKSYRAPTGWDVFMGRTQPIEINPYDK